MLADIGPGMRVFETGVGSGALSMTMLRWGATIVGYEIREDFANRAKANVREFLGEQALDRYDVHIADSYEGIDAAHGPFDRVVLDLPEPWQVVPHAETVLRAGRRCWWPTRRRSRRPPRPARQLEGALDRRPHARGAAPRLAHRGSGGAPRPPDGGPHGVPHRRPLPRPGARAMRADPKVERTADAARPRAPRAVHDGRDQSIRVR